MGRIAIKGAALALAAAFAGIARGDDPLPSAAPGWTGVTNPEAVILARQGLMNEMERLMRPIDTFTVDATIEHDDLRSAALTISQMLVALPHLFPPTTNLYDPDSAVPVTIALPAIWDDFPTFDALADAAAASATTMASLSEADALRTGGAAMRAACDACHASFLRPYERGTVSEGDLDFDFDSFFEGVEDGEAPR